MFAGTFAAIASLTSSSAFAGTNSGSMLVNAIILNSCTVIATPMAFGTLSVLGGSNYNSTSIITLTCTPLTAYDVALDNGLYSSSGVRRMRNLANSAYISYNIYSDASRTAAWGSTSGNNTVAGTTDITGIKLLTAYGRIPSSATSVAAGVYDDTVTVSVTF